jgi:hypothetical protein
MTPVVEDLAMAATASKRTVLAKRTGCLVLTSSEIAYCAVRNSPHPCTGETRASRSLMSPHRSNRHRSRACVSRACGSAHVERRQSLRAMSAAHATIEHRAVPERDASIPPPGGRPAAVAPPASRRSRLRQSGHPRLIRPAGAHPARPGRRDGGPAAPQGSGMTRGIPRPPTLDRRLCPRPA